MRTRPRMLSALAVAACTSTGGTGSSKSEEKATDSATTVVVGATLSLSGSLDAYGPPIKAGHKLQIADVNAAGGVTVGGKKEQLRLVVLDNGSDPSTASA